jgi:hypothetical protein
MDVPSNLVVFLRMLRDLGGKYDRASVNTPHRYHTSGRRESRRRLYELRMSEGGRLKYRYDDNGSLRRVAC